MPSITASPRLRKIIIALTSFSCTGVAFSGLAHAEPTQNLSGRLNKLGYEQGEIVDRVEHYRVNGWNYIDDQHIVIYAGPGNRFLITTLNYCRDLSSAENIGFTTTTSSLTKFDKLVVRGAGGIVQNCSITEIRTLTKTEAKR